MTVTAPMPSGPFRGLASFGESELDALLFFGREREIEIVVANLLASRLTVLYGPSGVGKTSLLRAGVARRVRELAGKRALGRGPDGAVIVFSSWPADPVSALGDAIAGEVRAVTGREGPGPTTGLADVIDHWATILDGEIFIVLDQLEEFFVYHHTEHASGSLLAELPEVIVRPQLRAHVLLSLRDDALADLDAFGGTVPNLFANVIRLDHLDTAAATSAILGPVQQFNDRTPAERHVHVEPELVAAVLDQARTTEDPTKVEPPLLQLVMQRLWDVEIQRGSHELRASTLAELGGAGEIVREHLDRALSALTDDDQGIAERIFDHLVTPSGTKVSQLGTDLTQYARVPSAEVDPVITTLERERILRQTDEGGGGRRYEIFHDVLAGAILDWRRGRELDHERKAARRHQRRLVTVGLAALAAVLVMAAITIYALTQRSTARSQARSADARALVAVALTQLDKDPELSLVLARRAAHLSTSELVENALRESLLHSRVRHVVPLGAPGMQAVFEASGRNAVALTAAGRVVVADPASGRILRSFAVGAPRALIDPTGRRVIAFGLHHPPTLYSTATGSATQLPSRPTTGTVFSRDGDVLVTIDSGRLVHVWDAESGRLLRILRAARPPLVAAVSSDDTKVAVGGGREGRTVESFSITTGARIARPVIDSVVTHLAFGPAGRLLAAAGADKTVTLLNPKTGARRAVLRGHTGAITSIAFNSRATLLATTSTDGTARVWSTSGKLVTILAGHGLDVTSAVFSPDGFRVVTASKDGTARVWHASNGITVAVLAGHGAEVATAEFSQDGRSVVTVGEDGTMRLWDAVAEPTLTVVRTEPWPLSAARAADGRIVVAPRGSPDVSVSADGDLFATAERGRVFVRRTSNDELVATIPVPGNVTGVALAPDGRTVAAAGSDGNARIYRLDGSLVRKLDGNGAPLTRIAFDPQGTLLAAGSTDHTARIWSLSTGRMRVLRGDTDTVASARFNPDGSRLVTAGRDHYARIRDVATGRIIEVLRGAFGAVSDAAFSPDGRWVVTAGPGKAGLFDAHSGVLLFYLQGHEGPLTSASFAPDGRTIVTSGIDRTVRTYRCDLCVGLSGLEAIADARLQATHRTLTAVEERGLLP